MAKNKHTTEETIKMLDEAVAAMVPFWTGPLPTKLPVFKGYTVDKRLREFRKVIYGKNPGEPFIRLETLPFVSEKGAKMLDEYEETLLVMDADKVIESVHQLVGKIKEKESRRG